MAENTQIKLKTAPFPRGLFTFFFVNAAFMSGLIMINALLVLYLTRGIRMDVKHAYNVYAAFGALFYSSALLGGFLGGRYDHKTAVIFGGLLAGCGSFLITIPNIEMIFLGLSCFIVGSGLMIPNINCLTGKLFAKDDPLRDGGFTVAYIGTNVGSFVTAFASGFIARYFSYETAYFFSSSMVLVSVVLFVIGYKRFNFHSSDQVIPYKSDVSMRNLLPMIVAAIITVPAIAILLSHAEVSNVLLIIGGILMTGVVLSIARKQKDKKARKKLYAFLIFTLFGLAFWALYMLAPSALTIFVQNNVNRHIGTFIIPTSSVYSLNPFFIITVGALTTLYFFRKSLKGERLPLRNKFAIGIISMGAGYITLVLAISFAGKSGYIAFYWIVISYFLQTLGELFIGPIGFAMAGALAPAHLEGMMMGFFQLSTGVAGAISGFLASATATAPQHIADPHITNPTFAHFFALYGSITVAIGILIVSLTPQFKKLWSD
jgi:proton-dependent oligopeptide transporter, POT family